MTNLPTDFFSFLLMVSGVGCSSPIVMCSVCALYSQLTDHRAGEVYLVLYQGTVINYR